MKKTLIAATLFALTQPVNATEAPDASTLVGNAYGGIHALYLNNDNDRLTVPNDWNSNFDDGYGYGVELGYRFSEALEFRAAVTDLNMDMMNSNYAKPNSNSISVDALYFPNHKNGYVLAGVNRMRMNETDTMLDAGFGYRQYYSNKFAVYAEVKGMFEFNKGNTDFTAGLGFIYFFGDNASTAKTVAKTAPVQEEVKPVAPVNVDSDNDGVFDQDDKCANTPVEYKVDASGCTLYENEKVSMNLLVNFANNKFEVSQDSMAKVKELADFMVQYPATTVVIEGHTSAVGKAEYNQYLSEARAEAVAQLLVNKFGIDASRVSSKGYGETRLLDKATTKEANAKNRRIEATITTDRKVAVTK